MKQTALQRTQPKVGTAVMMLPVAENGTTPVAEEKRHEETQKDNSRRTHNIRNTHKKSKNKKNKMCSEHIRSTPQNDWI